MTIEVCPLHRIEGCLCLRFVEHLLVLEGRVVAVQIPACQTLPPYPSRDLQRWLAGLVGERLVTRDQALTLLFQHRLPWRIVEKLTRCGLGLYTLRELARHTRGLPRQKCHHCGRRFNGRSGSARAVEVYRLHGHTYRAVVVLACSISCAHACIHENLEYLRCLKNALALTRALKKQLKAIRGLCRERQQQELQVPTGCPTPGPSRAGEKNPATDSLPRPDSAPATTSPAS